MNIHSFKKLGLIVGALLFTFMLKAQDCSTIVYLESQTVKSGDLLSSSAGMIIDQPGKQFVVESNGNATLSAGRRIELYYGFKALTGSVLHAGIVACDPGQPNKDNVVVYPNPTDGVFSIKSSYKIDAVRLTDTNGATQLTKTDIGDTSVTLDISKLQPGYYLLEIIVGKSVSETVRIEKK
jgi:hypothetical protein